MGWILTKLHDRLCECRFTNYADQWDGLDARREPHDPEDWPARLSLGKHWANGVECDGCHWCEVINGPRPPA